MERTMYQEEIREMSSRLSSLSYELGNCAESLWDIIGHEEDEPDMEFLSELCRNICSMHESVQKELAKMSVRMDIRKVLAEMWEKMEEKNGADTRAAATVDDSGEIVQTPAEEILCTQESQ